MSSGLRERIIETIVAHVLAPLAQNTGPAMPNNAADEILHLIGAIDAAGLGEEAAERERALREENERLRGKCNRLTAIATLEWEEYYNIALHEEKMSDAKARRYANSVTGLQDGDLEGEPHGAASETEAE